MTGGHDRVSRKALSSKQIVGLLADDLFGYASLKIHRIDGYHRCRSTPAHRAASELP